MKPYIINLIILGSLIIISGCSATNPLDVQEQLGSLNTQAAQAYQDRDYAAALIPAQEATLLSRAEFGPNHPQTLSNQTHLSLLYVMLGQFDSSESLYESELHINRRVFGPNHPKTLISLNNLAIDYVSLGRYKEAGPLLEEALRINENSDIHRVTTLNNLAYLYLLQGRMDEVEPIYQEVQNVLQNGGALVDPAAFVGQDKITWVASIITDSGEGDGGRVIDCSMFQGTGPFNPDPETGGDMAQCGPFGTMPTYGMWGGWGSGDGFGGGDGGTPDPPGGGGDGGGSEPPGFPDEDRERLPIGIEEDFNGCASQPPGSGRDNCCSHTASDCAAACPVDPPGGYLTCTWACEDAEPICKAGDDL